MKTPILKILPDTPVDTFQAYSAMGGGKALEKTLAMPRERVIAEVKISGLRGRGGAGFPTGLKWASVAHDPCPVKYFVCNAAEGEPGTFKDRMLIRRNPYQLLEGIAIGAYAIDARKAYIVIKKSFKQEWTALNRALKEMTVSRSIGTIPIEIVRGPEDYLLGEEKALLEVIEGGAAMPREAGYPPYMKGLFVKDPSELNPAVVNNAETLSNIPHIMRNGAEWFRSFGTATTPGTMVFTISGDVRKQGIYELPMGTTLRELLYKYGGGPLPGRKFKAVFSGVANAVILPSMFDTPLTFDGMNAAGTGLGSGGFIAYDDTTCMVRVAHMFSRFLWIESCNQCSACKQGTDRSTVNLNKLMQGKGDETTVQNVIEGAVSAPQGNRCYLPFEHLHVTTSILKNFSEEFLAHYKRGCKSCRELTLPKMEDYDEKKGAFTYSAGRSQP
ncbi:MAG TPA: NADH-ubiquinone oxidoreductase-F iron-sulfur binding region domain-containing protein [Candidatus Kapabacteria bacterium]|nr:NADH-ubiquinone oxidoreductase-F iron-sulfur binding region domain-containing protein [Candidatus Kapabacteria bacterium]